MPIRKYLALFVAKEWEGALCSDKMSTLDAQEVFWSSWKLTIRKILLAKLLTVVWFQNEIKMINLDENNKEVVDSFFLPRDVLSKEGSAKKVVTSKIKFAWRKFKEVSNVTCRKLILINVRCTLDKRYVRSALTSGAECLALKNEKALRENLLLLLLSSFPAFPWGLRWQ